MASRAELKQAALAAEALLRLDAARQYGLVAGGPEVVYERCEAVIADAAEQGITYDADEIDGALVALLSEAAAA